MKSILPFTKNSLFSIHLKYINLTCISKFSNLQCWKCDHNKTKLDLFCQKCGIIQKPIENDNYFNLFEIEEKFQVDEKSLKNKYRQLQSYLHPDKFSYKTDEEKLISKDYSSLLNKAFNTLVKPMTRAEYLLQLRGQKLAESETVTNPTFLVEIMEINEKVEEAGKNIDKLKILDKENKEEIEQLSNKISQNFMSNDTVKAKENIIKMKYYSSVKQRLNEMLRDLGVTD